MESVEVWMWTIAGLIFAGILITGSFKFLTYYTHNMDVKQAQESFNKLTQMTERVCGAGLGSAEAREIILPYVIANLSTTAREGVYADRICMTLQDEKPSCYDFTYCNATMKPIDLTSSTSFFKLLQKAVSGPQVGAFKVRVEKTDYRNITISWTQTVVQ